MSGIGGQGIQLAAATLAEAAAAEGRAAQLFGSYGGMMRGGATEATVVLADGSLDSPPTVGTAWAAILMHHEHVAGPLGRVGTGGLLFFDSAIVDPPERTDLALYGVQATELAQGVGGALAASMVMIGATAGASGLVGLDALLHAVRVLLPPYRARHLEVNDAALRAGYGSVERSVSAWGPQPTVDA